MPEDTVNTMITDAVTQSVASVLGNSPAGTKSMLDALMAETLGMAMYNAVANQHNAQMTGNASTTAACVRMLKTKPAAPGVTADKSKPMVISVTPSVIPIATTATTVRISGVNFDPGLTAEITLTGLPFATLHGSSQLSDLTSTGFSFSNALFTGEGSYGLQVMNPDGGLSPVCVLNVMAQAPVITSVQPSSDGKSAAVQGSNFMTGLSMTVSNQNGNPVAVQTIINISNTGCTVNFVDDLSKGVYAIQITNTDKRSSNNFLFNF